MRIEIASQSICIRAIDTCFVLCVKLSKVCFPSVVVVPHAGFRGFFRCINAFCDLSYSSQRIPSLALPALDPLGCVHCQALPIRPSMLFEVA